jgi:hypothetical protein
VTRVRRRGDLRAAVAVETRRRGCSARRRGSARVAKSGEASTASWVHGIEYNYTGRLPTFLRSSGSTPCRLSGDDGENPKAAALGFRRGRSARGGGRLIKAWEPALACGPRGGACSSRTRAAAWSDSKTSPARGRRCGGDDQWGPLVNGTSAEAGSGCGRELDGPQAQAGWLAQLLRWAALNGPRARAAACWACYWATAWLERAASWLLGWK